MDADAPHCPDDYRLTMNGGADSASEPVQGSLFEVVNIEEGRAPIYRPTRGIDKDATKPR
jgi:hypothetical protein